MLSSLGAIVRRNNRHAPSRRVRRRFPVLACCLDAALTPTDMTEKLAGKADLRKPINRVGL
jgi:hypothetical protein